MAVLNWGKRNVGLFLAGSNTDYPTHFMIGNGSGTVVNTQTALISPFDRQEVTGINGSTVYKITWIGDWNSVEMSGTQLQEWGLTIAGAGTTGSMWSRTAMENQIEFDGTAELRIEETVEVF